ncbi:MAG: hypothetical protein ACLTXR_00220 [Clostridia bacterium]
MNIIKLKVVVIDGKVMTAEEIITLAKLPSRQDITMQNLLVHYLAILQNLQLHLIK